MDNNKITNISFKGYDAIPLKAIYMQGIRKRAEKCIFREMKKVLQEEGVDLFVNSSNINFAQKFEDKPSKTPLSIWAQDNKAFVKNKNGKQLLWNNKEEVLTQEQIIPFDDFQINAARFMPKGGDYYLGYKKNGEKWLIINSVSVSGNGTPSRLGDLPTNDVVRDVLDVKERNVTKVFNIAHDLDEMIRPVGYPYVLVNDYAEALNMVEEMHKKFPHSHETYNEMKNFLVKEIEQKDLCGDSTEVICERLRENNFIPIKIGAHFLNDINFINAIAFKNKNNNITYISNSTKRSYPELQFLEHLFDKTLKEKVPNIDSTHYISGGKRTFDEKYSDSHMNLFGRGLQERNVIMDILANRLGGIHCMSAEVPDFTKIENSLKK